MELGWTLEYIAKEKYVFWPQAISDTISHQTSFFIPATCSCDFYYIHLLEMKRQVTVVGTPIPYGCLGFIYLLLIMLQEPHF